MLLILGSLALFTGIIEGPRHGWTSALVLGAFAGAAVLFSALGAHQPRAAHPLVDPRLFASARLRTGTLGMAATFLGLFAFFYVNAQYLQHVRGYSPALAGLALAPMAFGMMALARQSPARERRWGERPVAALGLDCVAGGRAGSR